MGYKVPILTYHSIDDSGSVISISPDKFRSQMYYLRDKNFNIIPLKDVVACLRRNLPLPPRSIAITFDDGFKNFYEVAYPVLKDCGFTAMVFLVPGHCGKNNKWEGQSKRIPVLNLLGWEEIREMADKGIDFGAHTINHTDLPKLSVKQASEEIVNSKQVIEKNLGKNVQFFAYPYGELNHEIKAIVKNHYSGACSVEMDFVNIKSDIYALPRIDMYYFCNNNLFIYIGTPVFFIYVTFRSILRSIRNKIHVVTQLLRNHKY